MSVFRDFINQFPDNWNVFKVKDLYDVISGNTPRRSNKDYYKNGTLPWVKTKDLNNKAISETEENLTENAIEECPIKIIPEDTVLVAMYGGFNQIGRTGLLKIKAATNQAISALIPKKEEKPHPYYIQSWFNQNVRLWQKIAASSRKDPNIRKSDLENFPIILPSTQYQQNFVDILKLWDKYLIRLKKLIKTKKRYKKGLMQQLLSGNKRYPEFEDEPWIEAKIGDLLKEVERDVDWDDSAKYDLISVKRRSEGIVHRESLYGHEIKTKNLKTVKAGDYIVSRMQVLHGASALATEEFEGTKVSGSYHTLVVRDEDKLDIEFFNYLSQTPYLYHLAYISSHGVHIEKMTFKIDDYLKKKIRIPSSAEEQAKIVSVLDNIEKQISLYKRELKAVKKQKKGLMQKLLTGKVRVNQGEATYG